MIEAGLKHILIESDQEIIRKMAKEISDQGRLHFVNNFKVNKELELLEMNTNGFGAELAFCNMAGAEFDSSTNGSESHFKKVDCTLPDKRTVDVKTTVYTTGKLFIRCGKEATKVDIFVLMTGKFPVFTFRGWANYSELVDPKKIRDFGYIKSYCLEQHELNKFL